MTTKKEDRKEDKKKLVETPEMRKTEDLILKMGLVSKGDMLEAKQEAAKTGKPFEDVLLAKKLITTKDYDKVRSTLLEIPYVDISRASIPKKILLHLPEEVAKKYHVVIFGEDKGKLKIATSNPEDFTIIEFIEKRIGHELIPYMASNADITKALDQYSGVQTEVEKAIEKSNILPHGAKDLEKIDTSDTISQDAPISRLVNTVIEHGVVGGASDIHIEPSSKELLVRYRLDGILHKSITLPKAIHAAIISRIKVVSNLKIDETRVPQDGRFHGRYGDKDVDFRVSTMPTVNGEKAVLRVLDKSTALMTLAQLGVRGKGYDILYSNVHKPHGMTLVTGPTGSGKSTTLYAIIGILNDSGVNIVTLEDPVEYYIDGINQSQVRPNINYDFASGLRSIVRQDPDIIMVGEIRDFETADMAVHAALTGHIVLSTLHTNDAAGTVPRLIDMGVEPFLIASSVNTIIAQRLTRKICDDCREEVKLPQDIMDDLKKELKNVSADEIKQRGIDISNTKLYKGKGCDQCKQTGYRGRIGIFEILPITGEVEELVVKKASARDIKEVGVKEGMITLKQDGILKALEGITTIEEVWRVTSE